MEDLIFEWNSKNNEVSINKQGVSFFEARTALTDEFARLIADPDHSGEGERFVLLGESIDSRVLIVCYCIRDEDTICIISARKADKRELKMYEGFRYA